MPAHAPFVSRSRRRLLLLVGVVLVLLVGFGAPAGADTTDGQALAFSAWAYNWNTYLGSALVTVTNDGTEPLVVNVDPTTAVGASAATAPSITADTSRCWAPVAPGSFCFLSFNADLTGMTPGTMFQYVISVNGQTLPVKLGVPTPPVDVQDSDDSIDPGTGNTTASGLYDSSFAPAQVTVTRTTASGAIRIVRHVKITNYGKHPWQWHGFNDQGRRVSPGVYHLTVTVGGQRHSRKVVVR
jgi:hypothetical protein